MSKESKKALLLTGGGARGAYQAGVIKAIGEIFRGRPFPFDVISGTSAGSINATALTSFLSEFKNPYSKLDFFWSNLTTEQVYKTDTLTLFSNAFRWIKTLGIHAPSRKSSLSLFDNRPLQLLLQKNINFSSIHKSIHQHRHVESLAINAVSYHTGISRTFFDSNQPVKPWQREKRDAIKTSINLSHILASSAIPLLFSPVPIDKEYYGDGSMRELTPLSPCIKLGAEKILIVGVRKQHQEHHFTPYKAPTSGKVLSTVLNSILMDSVDYDLERMNRMNEIISEYKIESTKIKKIDSLILAPSIPLSELALDSMEELKGTLRFFVKGLGELKESADFLSYILFEGRFTSKLSHLGYQDTMKKSEEVYQFLK